MKGKWIILSVLALSACIKPVEDPQQQETPLQESVQSPTPTEQIDKVQLTKAEAGYVSAGNQMAFRLLPKLNEGRNVVYSPLSLQYALAMTANGASGNTLRELVDFLGYGQDIDALNAFSKKMLEQLPAVDLGVKLKLADALLVNADYPLLPSYQQLMQDYYYATVKNMPFTDRNQVAGEINDWASQNTEGLIDRMLEPDQLDPTAVAYLMNALYFKAPWASFDKPLFNPDLTAEAPFFLGGCEAEMIPMMHGSQKLPYVHMDGFGVLELPYAGGKFGLYILLPDDEIKGDPVVEPEFEEKYFFGNLMQDLPGLDWNALRSQMSPRTVNVTLPKFEATGDFQLKKIMQSMGVEQAFIPGAAQFDRMFAPRPAGEDYAINEVFQKARISVAEWGTEAAAVTVVEMTDKSIGPFGEDPVNFVCDHRFVYLIGEKTSGAILFAGIFNGL